MKKKHINIGKLQNSAKHKIGIFCHLPPGQSKRTRVVVCCLLSIFYQVICSLILAENQNKIITGAQTSLIKQRYFVYHKIFRPWKALYYCKHSIRKNKLSSNFRCWIKASLAWVNSIFYHKTFIYLYAFPIFCFEM